MSFATSIGYMQNAVAKAFAGTTVKVTKPGISAFATDLSVTISTSSFTVDCSNPRAYVAQDGSGNQLLAGSTYVLVNRADSSITFDPQPGMIAEVSGEQYRISKVEFIPGAIRLFLQGGAAEGTASS